MASERGKAQTVRMFKAVSVVRAGLWGVLSGWYGAPERLQICILVEHRWISGAIEGDSPVDQKVADLLNTYPSSAGHVKPRVNLGGPSPKAKYSSVTDSEPVP